MIQYGRIVAHDTNMFRLTLLVCLFMRRRRKSACTPFTLILVLVRWTCYVVLLFVRRRPLHSVFDKQRWYEISRCDDTNVTLSMPRQHKQEITKPRKRADLPTNFVDACRRQLDPSCIDDVATDANNPDLMNR